MTDGVTRHIFFVDDESGIRETVLKTLRSPETEVSCFASQPPSPNRTSTPGSF